MTRRRRPAAIASAWVLAVAALAGCEAGPGGTADASADGRPIGAELADQATAVVLTEMAVATASPWPAGPQLLHVRNEGGAHHNLIICPGDATGCDDGGGVPMDLLVKPEVRDPAAIPDRTSSLVLGAGADAVVRVDALDPGSYVLWCAIPNHAARGMQRIIEVG